MKTKYFILSLVFTLATMLSFAAIKTDTIKVYGNCESCKNRIEKAAKEAGATAADWDEKTELLVVSYDDVATTNFKIQQKIASVGHDTQDVKAKDGDYKKLEKCCQYPRKTAGTSLINKSCCNQNNYQVAAIKNKRPSLGKGYYYIGSNAKKLSEKFAIVLLAKTNNKACAVNCCI